MPQVSRRPTSAHSREPFHPYKKVAEDALSRGTIDIAHVSGAGTDIRLAAIVRKQAAQFTRYRRNCKQASRPRLPSCDEPKAGNDVSASAEDSTYVQRNTHEEVAADAIVSDGVSGSNTTPERTDVTKGLLPWPAGFFGGVWKRLIGDAPVSGVYVPINSAAAHAERHTQHDEILARKRGREDDDDDEGEDEDVHTTITGAKGDQEQGVTSKEHRERHRARKRRRDTEPEESTCTSEVSCADDLQQDMHVGEETGQAGGAREPETLALDPGNQSSHDAANPEQERIVEEAVCPEAECSSGADEFAGDDPDPEQGGDGEEAAREEDGYCSVADGSMYDTEDSGEGHNREEESGDEFEGFFHIGSSEERELDDEENGGQRSERFRRLLDLKDAQRESEQSEASDTKGKKRAVDVNPLAFPRPLDTGVFSRVPLDLESAAKKASTSGHGWTSQPPTRSAKTFASVELQELQETLESKIRQNIRQELGQIVEAAVANAIAKALPNGLI
ncbi:hypothetical protein EDD15DRAFT_2374035 [Pisolithus albus]|nr:hypothetical protein EDD15DRAFT_2374035 [Pisolithus albus]